MSHRQRTGYLAQEKYLPALRMELSGICEEFGRLILAEGKPQRAYWAQNIWYEPEKVSFSSIGDAARLLRERHRNWVLYSHDFHRRASLIQEQLPHVSAKELDFPATVPSGTLGSFVLLDRNTLLCSAQTSSPFPHGEARFKERKVGPPNRAYLKLWELFTLLGDMPRPGARCLDVGASPGGWTWVLAELGAEVLAVDRAELADNVVSRPNVSFLKGDAFSVTPESSGSFDWVFSDVIAYPDKLFPWVQAWIASGKCRNLVCTIKFKGTEHYGMISRFAALPARLLHLSVNKHELTCIWRAALTEVEVSAPLMTGSEHE